MILNFDPNTGLLPAVVQHATTRDVLMLGYVNQASLERTRETAHAMLKDFNPYDAHELIELIEDTAADMSIRQALALIRFSKFDPDVAAACIPHLLYNVEQGEEEIEGCGA